MIQSKCAAKGKWNSNLWFKVNVLQKENEILTYDSKYVYCKREMEILTYDSK